MRLLPVYIYFNEMAEITSAHEKCYSKNRTVSALKIEAGTDDMFEVRNVQKAFLMKKLKFLEIIVITYQIEE